MERAERWSSTASPPSILRLHSVLPQTLSSCIPSVSTHALIGKLERTAVYVHVPQVSLNKCSILKKQNEYHSEANSISRQQPTASILKHKTSDHNQTEQTSHISHSVPVTFSSSVVDLSSKRHGILKKRSSLDESQIIRRRSCSPDVSLAKTNCSEFKPILKHERRSSLDEMIRRAQSPDLHPTSILKHNIYRDNDRECHSNGAVEPQGILKRKSWSNISETNTGLHVNIATFVPKAAVGGSELVEISEVRPILKKKHSREDALSCESVCLEPRPILKKKSSLESEESDEKPKKTILKCLQKHSQDRNPSYETTAVLSPKKLSMLRNCLTQSLPKDFFHRDTTRPILKQNNLIRPYYDYDKDLFIRNQTAKGIRPNDSFFRKRAQSVEHVCTLDSESEILLSVLSKRRSLESVYFSDTQEERFGCKFISKGISPDLTQDFVSPQCRQCLRDASTSILKIPDRS